ncbi:MAG: helix-turn-helix transcriptional regulator [Clostridiales bacterium]|jgi:transcriptional regulator with XRE-family HTH domain|nr:helix-turn-helix transcriptional regulator [Clostridiales bacterium]
MAKDFPRTLSLLRKERGNSQREVAAALGISQALLSHYEKGAREPGLKFLVHAADYYGVSTDYLLGRTMARGGEQPFGEPLEPEDHRALCDTVALIFRLLARIGSKTLTEAVERCFTLTVYKIFRLLCMANPQSNQALFGVPPETFAERADIGILRAACAMKTESCAQRGSRTPQEPIPALGYDMLATEYADLALAAFELLHRAEELLREDA